MHGLLYFFTDGPEVSTVEINNRSMHASEDLTLRCDFDSVPIPSVDWVHNDTIDLDNTSSRVSIMTTVISENRGISILKLTPIGIDGGGLYTCTFSTPGNVVSANVTTVFALGECVTVIL